MFSFDILHTMKTGDWVDHGKTLREQGIVETEVLLFKRKFVYEEADDTDNPIQRNLIYEQVGKRLLLIHINI